MIFFLLSSLFSSIHGDCLEFTNIQSTDGCLIKESINHGIDIDRYYPECLLCAIHTKIESENLKVEENNSCSAIELQCIQLMFDNQEIFEDFFHSHQQYISDLFDKDNGTSQNTLHVMLKEHTLEEINLEYIEKHFQLDYQAYRVLFFELYIEDSNINIHRNLANITRLSVKIILNCRDGLKRRQTIYVIHEQNITLESKQNFCSAMLIPSPITISSTLLFARSSTVVIATSPHELLSISNAKSKHIVFIIILLTGLLLGLLITSLIYCCKHLRRHYVRVSQKMETPKELTISEDISVETPVPLNEKPKWSLKLKQPARGIRAIQLLDGDDL